MDVYDICKDVFLPHAREQESIPDIWMRQNLVLTESTHTDMSPLFEQLCTCLGEDWTIHVGRFSGSLMVVYRHVEMTQGDVINFVYSGKIHSFKSFTKLEYRQEELRPASDGHSNGTGDARGVQESQTAIQTQQCPKEHQ